MTAWLAHRSADDQLSELSSNGSQESDYFLCTAPQTRYYISIFYHIRKVLIRKGWQKIPVTVRAETWSILVCERRRFTLFHIVTCCSLRMLQCETRENWRLLFVTFCWNICLISLLFSRCSSTRFSSHAIFVYYCGHENIVVSSISPPWGLTFQRT